MIKCFNPAHASHDFQLVLVLMLSCESCDVNVPHVMLTSSKNEEIMHCSR